TWRDEAIAAGHARVETARNVGEPWRSIVSFADSRAADLVVMGTLGRTGISRVLLGSVAERVVRHAHCSVLVVPASGASPGRFQRVLCAIAFSDQARVAMHGACALATGRDASVPLVHAYQLPMPVGEYVMDGRWIQEALDVAQRSLTEWQADARQRVPCD